jgi:hypothetical protein
MLYYRLQKVPVGIVRCNLKMTATAQLTLINPSITGILQGEQAWALNIENSH